MVDNKGNAYRTSQAMSLGVAVIGIAIAMLAYFAAGVGIIASAGIFVCAVGIAVLAMTPFHNGTPDKFGPSEKDYRLAMGAVITIIGLLMVLTILGLEWYWYVAILIIAVAVIGMIMAVVNSRKISNE